MLSADIIVGIIFAAIGSVIYYVKKEKKKYKLIKDFDLDGVNEVIIAPRLEQKYKEADANKINTLFRAHVKRFIKILEEKIPKNFLQNFYNNINETDIAFSLETVPKNLAGFYYAKGNVIRLSPLALASALNHELLHLASSCIMVDKNSPNHIECVGFRQGNDTFEIGRGINEGYTVHLDRKYFSLFKTESRRYNFMATIAELMEIVIGDKKMEELYFTSNLYGLHSELLNKCASSDEIFNFLNDCDFIYCFYGKDNIFIKSQKDEIEKRIQRIFKFLIRSYYFNLLLKDDKDKENKLNNFIQKIPRRKILGIRVYNVINEEVIKEAISEAKERYSHAEIISIR